jgi:uncharacterized protein YbaP (TraB family)
MPRPLALLLLSVVAASAAAQDEPTPPDPVAVLDTVVVTGAQPGPGMWKVTKGDHVLWVLGTLRPLPKKMQWLSRDVEATIAESQEVVMNASASFQVGVFSGLALLPSLVGARDNPDDKKLAEVVPPELYGRWDVQKQKYIGKDKGVEKRRPLFAADELYEAAIDKSGLSRDDVVEPVVTKAAKKHDVAITRPQIKIKLEKPRQAVKEFKKGSLEDLECFERTIARVETDLDIMKVRANAWATGDIQALRDLPYTDQNPACEDAVLRANVSQERGFDDLKPRLRAMWLEAIDAALEKNATTFTMLSMGQLLGDDGLLAELKAKGYEVVEPE